MVIMDVLVLMMLFTIGNFDHIRLWHTGMQVFVVLIGFSLAYAFDNWEPAAFMVIWFLFGVGDLIYALIMSSIGFQWPAWEWLNPAFRWEWLDLGLPGFFGLIAVTTVSLVIFAIVGIGLSLGIAYKLAR